MAHVGSLPEKGWDGTGCHGMGWDAAGHHITECHGMPQDGTLYPESASVTEQKQPAGLWDLFMALQRSDLASHHSPVQRMLPLPAQQLLPGTEGQSC